MTAITTTADDLRATFAPMSYDNDPEMSPLYDKSRELHTTLRTVEAEIARCEKLIKSYTRTGHTSRLPKIEVELQSAMSDLVSLTASISDNDAAIAAIRDARRAHEREVFNAYMADLMSAYGTVQFEGGIPTHVEFVSAVAAAGMPDVTHGHTFAIVNRGELRFGVGVRGDENRYFRFGFDVDVYAPDAGYLSNDGKVQSSRKATVSWGSIGATDPDDTKLIVTILTIAAELAGRMNVDLGL